MHELINYNRYACGAKVIGHLFFEILFMSEMHRYVFGSFLEREDFRDINTTLLLSESISSYKALKLALHIGSDQDLEGNESHRQKLN